MKTSAKEFCLLGKEPFWMFYKYNTNIYTFVIKKWVCLFLQPQYSYNANLEN